MNKKGLTLIEILIATGVVAILVIGGFFLFSDNENMETPETTSNQNYVGNSVEECSRIQVMCIEGFERFDDEDGCGCREVVKTSAEGTKVDDVYFAPIKCEKFAGEFCNIAIEIYGHTADCYLAMGDSGMTISYPTEEALFLHCRDVRDTGEDE